jgi:hypothetical protein
MSVNQNEIDVNDLKKGAEVILKNSWKARLEDSKKGQTRMATVFGFCTEMGSAYATDIMFAIVNGVNVRVKHPEKYLKNRMVRAGFGF